MVLNIVCEGNKKKTKVDPITDIVWYVDLIK